MVYAKALCVSDTQSVDAPDGTRLTAARDRIRRRNGLPPMTTNTRLNEKQAANPYVEVDKILAEFNTPQIQCETDSGIATIPLAQEVSFGSWQPEIPEE